MHSANPNHEKQKTQKPLIDGFHSRNHKRKNKSRPTNFCRLTLGTLPVKWDSEVPKLVLIPKAISARPGQLKNALGCSRDGGRIMVYGINFV
jgi:hypothetical protein